MSLSDDIKKAMEVAIELKYAQCLKTFLNYNHMQNLNNHVLILTMFCLTGNIKMNIMFIWKYS